MHSKHVIQLGGLTSCLAPFVVFQWQPHGLAFSLEGLQQYL